MPIILQLYYKYYKFSVSGPSETSKYLRNYFGEQIL